MCTVSIFPEWEMCMNAVCKSETLKNYKTGENGVGENWKIHRLHATFGLPNRLRSDYLKTF